MKRVIVQKNGTTGNGKLIFVGESMEMFLHEANRVLNMSCTIVYTEKGGVVEDIRVIRDDEVLYLSEGEQFIDPKYAVATRPLMSKCNADEGNMCVDQNDWVSLNVGGKRFTTTSSLISNLGTTGSPLTTGTSYAASSGSSLSTWPSLATGSSLATTSSLTTGPPSASRQTIATGSPSSSITTGSTIKVTPHMSEVERNILMALVNQYRDAIETRRNDSNAVQRKAIAWAYVEKEYNSQPMVRNRRTKKQLRKAYENLKMRSKKDMKKQKFMKPQEPNRKLSTETSANMHAMMTESDIPAEIRTLLNPYDVEDTTYQNEHSSTIHDDSLSGTEEHGDVGTFDYPHLHQLHQPDNITQEHCTDARAALIRSSGSDNMQNECRPIKTDPLSEESMEITTKPLTKMFSSASTQPICTTTPQVQLVSPVAVEENEKASNIWRKEANPSADVSNAYSVYEDFREEKYQPDMAKLPEYSCQSDSVATDSCCQGTDDSPQKESKEPQPVETSTPLKESCFEARSHQELEMLILHTKLENERREHKLRIQLLRQQLKFWKKKTLNQK